LIKILLVLIAALLGGCLSLPGSEGNTPSRFALQGPAQACLAGNRTIAVSIVQVAAGLNTDRIARIQKSTGEFSYLRDVRWVDSAGAMIEQRMASDLECRGFVVHTGHRTRAGQSELLCELRALELQESSAGNQAVVTLSCTYQADDGTVQALVESATQPLSRWSATAAVQALGAAYAAVFENLYAALEAKAE
jgi:ABC-type uncharacterized transport system auxiliary subunit